MNSLHQAQHPDQITVFPQHIQRFYSATEFCPVAVPWHRLLTVYKFNITILITTEPVRENRLVTQALKPDYLNVALVFDG